MLTTSRALFSLSLTLALAAAPAAAQSSHPALVYATVQVNGAPFDLLLDLQVPAGAGPFPVVAWIHGGGWSGGSRLPIPGGVTRLVQRGYAVASIDYRLSGQAIWPAQIQDCKAAIRYLRANAATFGLDPDRIGVMGSSAGGHLVAALATMGGVGEVRSGSFVVDLEGTVGPHVGTSSRVQCAVDMFGPTDMLLANDFPTFDHDSNVSPESRLIGGAIQTNPEKWATVDPIPFVSPDDAPLLCMHGTDDTSVPFAMSELLVAAERGIGNDVAIYAVQDNGHGGPGFSTPEANAAIDAFLDRTLLDLPTTRVSVATIDVTASEVGNPGAFLVARDGDLSDPLTVRLWLGGDVESGSDCERVPLAVTIPAGATDTVVTLQPQQDSLVEGAEVAALHVVPTADYRIAHDAARAQVVIADDDLAAGLPIVSLLALDPAADEAGGNPGAVRFVRTGATTLPLTVQYELGGRADNGVDYAALSGTATIPAGSATVIVVVVPQQDLDREPGETVLFSLRAAATYARANQSSAHVVIADDDRLDPLPVVAVIGTDPALGEGGDDGHFSVTRTGATTQPLDVPVQLSGTAQGGADFAAIPAIVTIPAGADHVRVPVAVLDDTLQEGVESVVLRVAPSAMFVTSQVAAHELRIADDEAPTPTPSAVQLFVGPLRAGAAGTTTVLGGSTNGVAAIWIGLAPGYLPLPPFGTVQLDALQAGVFTGLGLDGAGAGTVALVVPASPALRGLSFWWQAVATVSSSPFLLLSDGVERVVH